MKLWTLTGCFLYSTGPSAASGGISPFIGEPSNTYLDGVLMDDKWNDNYNLQSTKIEH